MTPTHNVFVNEAIFGVMDSWEVAIETADWSNGLAAPMTQGAVIRTGINTGICAKCGWLPSLRTVRRARRRRSTGKRSSTSARTHPTADLTSSHSYKALPDGPPRYVTP